ncbi:MAG: DNA topoisomerase IV subunit A [Aerococcus sp.]|nr:DNA topoisomerase IV subunit A [Aerococcus sp.]
MIDIQELNLEDVMGDRFGRYSKYIIQDRALPDIRDGLKPVQRRILYAMYQDHNTADHPFRKSAKTVGNVIGNYHPHGDSSVYEAMVRMSQDWKNRSPLIDMHGNNGSLDGDPAAAMRYTEARLSPIAGELLQDLDKDTVDTLLNFDDTEEEPTVLPAAFPNLLVNGAQGISAGYATEIPTHNLGEVIDAVIYFIDHPTAKVKTIMNYLPGPDFPTGGIIQGKKELEKAYRTGGGRIVVRARSTVETLRSGRQQIVITEIPFEVNKAELVRRMDQLRLNRSIEGIIEVRDETDRSGLRIVIELKKDADKDQILQYFYKNTHLQMNYNFNMVAINQQRPEKVGILPILSAFVSHRETIIRRRTQFDLNKANQRLHIVEGLIAAISKLDEVIRLIRQSKNKAEAKERLMATFSFSEVQAEAIVSLQLYRLTNTDITALQAEKDKLVADIAHYEEILAEPAILKREMKQELRAIKKKYATPRRTSLEAEIEEITIKKEFLIPEEQVMTVVTYGGYTKRVSLRSYQSSKYSDLGLREGDHVLYLKEHSTLDNLVLFTNKGNYIYQPVYELQELKWKDIGEHLSQRIPLGDDEQVIAVYPYQKDSQTALVLATRDGQIKQTAMSEFGPFRGHKKKTAQAMRLNSKDPRDSVVGIELVSEAADPKQAEVLLVTEMGFASRYALEEVNMVGAKAKGVKSVNLKPEDHVRGLIYNEVPNDNDQWLLITQRGNLKRMKWEEVSPLGRAKRGLMVLKELKAHPHRVSALYAVESLDQQYEIYGSNGELATIETRQVPLSERYSNGSSLLDEQTFGEVIAVTPLFLPPTETKD